MRKLVSAIAVASLAMGFAGCEKPPETVNDEAVAPGADLPEAPDDAGEDAGPTGPVVPEDGP